MSVHENEWGKIDPPESYDCTDCRKCIAEMYTDAWDETKEVYYCMHYDKYVDPERDIVDCLYFGYMKGDE